MPDPYEEDISWDFALGGLSNRWEDTQHAIFKKLENLRTSLGNRAFQLRKEGRDSMQLKFDDPMIPFREAFFKLLAPKTFADPKVRDQRLTYMDGNTERNIESLSSGEREVLTIVFDLILRRPSHCIVFFDEPELHLHPELMARLIVTLRNIGEIKSVYSRHTLRGTHFLLSRRKCHFSDPAQGGRRQSGSED